MNFGSDVFRCVIAGSHRRGGETVEMGDTRFQAASVPWEAVVAGPEETRRAHHHRQPTGRQARGRRGRHAMGGTIRANRRRPDRAPFHPGRRLMAPHRDLRTGSAPSVALSGVPCPAAVVTARNRPTTDGAEEMPAAARTACRPSCPAPRAHATNPGPRTYPVGHHAAARRASTRRRDCWVRWRRAPGRGPDRILQRRCTLELRAAARRRCFCAGFWPVSVKRVFARKGRLRRYRWRVGLQRACGSRPTERISELWQEEECPRRS